MARDPNQVHPDGCDCWRCLFDDMDLHRLDMGLDPADTMVELPVRRSGKVVDWRMPEQWKPQMTNPRMVARILGLDQITPPVEDSTEVTVPVRLLFAGAWARFIGVDHDGQPITISGAVIGGPDPVEVKGRRLLAVLVRDYRGNPDVLLFTGEDADAVLADDPDDYEGREAHAVDPVFAPGASAVLLIRRVPVDGRRGERKVQEEHEQVSPGQLAEWEQLSGGDRELVAVWREHLPIGDLPEAEGQR